MINMRWALQFSFLISWLLFTTIAHTQTAQGPARGNTNTRGTPISPRTVLQSAVGSEASQFLKQSRVFTPNIASAPASTSRAPFDQIVVPMSESVTAQPDIHLLSDFLGPAFTGWDRPDPTIAVGDTNLLLGINAEWRIYDKVGNERFNASLDDWFQNVLDGLEDTHQPRILYDHFANEKRWLIFALTRDSALGRSFILASVSQTSDPLGPWWNWQLDAGMTGIMPTGLTAQDLNVGLNETGVYLSWNAYSKNGNFEYAQIRVLNKQKLASGDTLQWWDFGDLRNSDSSKSFAVQPAIVYDQGDFEYFVNTKPQEDSLIFMWKMQKAVDQPPLLQPSIQFQVSPYIPSPPARQAMSSKLIETGDGRVQNAVVRDGILWCSHTSGDDRLGPLTSVTQPIGIDLHANSVINGKLVRYPLSWEFMPTVTVDAEGRLYSSHYRSRTDSFVDLFVWATLPTFDKVDSLTCRYGEAPFELLRNRTTQPWGAYTGATIDPSDHFTVWNFGESVSTDDKQRWVTSVCAVSVKRPDLFVKCEEVPDTVKLNSAFKFTIHLANQGSSFLGKTRARVFLAPSDICESLPDSLLVDSFIQNGLNAGVTVTLQRAIRVQKVHALGRNRLIVVAETDHPSAEASLANNIFCKDIEVVPEMPLACSIEFKHPVENQYVCGDSIETVIQVSVSGGTPPYRFILAEINTTPAKDNDSCFVAKILILQDSELIKAVIVLVDSVNDTTVCSDSIKIKVDRSLPICELSYEPYFPFLKVKACDHESGIDTVKVILLRNAKVVITPYQPGDSCVVFRIDTSGTRMPVIALVEVVNGAGCSVVCDPILMQITAGNQGNPTQADFSRIDRYLNVDNLGLSRITLKINDYSFVLVADEHRRGRERNGYFIPLQGLATFDLDRTLIDGNNTIHFEAEGGPGTFANVTLANFALDEPIAIEIQPIQQVVPQSFALWQNYPNPFNPSTTIRFDIPPGESNRVSLRILDVNGKVVKYLFDNLMPAGTHLVKWHGRDEKDRFVSSGLYFYQLTVGNLTTVRKMVLTK